MAFLQCELIKLCLVSGAQGESPALAEPRAKLLRWDKSRLSYASGISDLKK